MGFFHNPVYTSYRHRNCPPVEAIEKDLEAVFDQKVQLKKLTPSWKEASLDESIQKSKIQIGEIEVHCHLHFHTYPISTFTIGFGSPGDPQRQITQSLTTRIEKNEDRFKSWEFASGYGKSTNTSGFSIWKKFIDSPYKIGSLLAIYVSERSFEKTLTTEFGDDVTFESIEQKLSKHLPKSNISTFIENERQLFKLINDQIGRGTR